MCPWQGRLPGRRRHGRAVSQGAPALAAVADRTIEARCSAILRALNPERRPGCRGSDGGRRRTQAGDSSAPEGPSPVVRDSDSYPSRRMVAISRYHDYMTKQTTIRLPEELADQAEAVARVRGTSINEVIVESLKAEIERVRADKNLTARTNRLLERDRELLERLAH